MHVRGLFLFLYLGTFALPSCKSSDAGNHEMVFWCSNNNQEIQLCVQLTKDWNQKNPANRIHMQPVPEGQSSEEVILAAVVGKTTPDIYANMWQGSVEMYAKAHALIALDTLPGFLSFIRERCDTNVIKEITSSDGHIYQVPWKVNPIMTIFNKSLFTANNIDTLPTTYSSYLDAAQIFKENNKNSRIKKRFGYTEVSPLWYQRLFNFYPLYLAASNGGSLVENNKAVFNNKYAVEVFRFLQSIYTHDYFSKEGSGSSSDPFVEQAIATKWTGPWEIPHLKNIPTRHFEFGYYPPIVPDHHSGPVHTYSDPKNIVIFSSCKKPERAWQFIKTIIDKPGDLGLLELTHQLPTRKNLESDPFYKEYFKKNPMMVTFAKEIPYLKGVDNCEQIVQVLDIISQEYEACVVYAKKTPEKAISDAETAVNVLLSTNQ